jgi:hypothetical protein
MTVVALLGAQSCSKKDTATPEKDVVAELSGQVKYSIPLFTVEELSVLDILSGQFGSNNLQKVTLELTVNKPDAASNATLSSNLKIGNYPAGIQTLDVTRIDKKTLVISFPANTEMFAGGTNGNPYASQSLMNKGIITPHFNNNSTWYTLSTSQLTGVYEVSEIKTNETVTGFKFTKKGTPSASFQIDK